MERLVPTARMSTSLPKRARSPSFVVAVTVGLVLLWVTGLVGLLLEGGDCFGPEPGCQVLRSEQAARRDVLVAMVLALTILGVVAVVVGRRIAPAALLVAALGMLGLGLAMGPLAISWAPKGLALTTLPVAIVALAAAGQVVEHVAWRPQWYQSWVGD
jgi:hypothetical protein